jgi:hypothetical protein
VAVQVDQDVDAVLADAPRCVVHRERADVAEGIHGRGDALAFGAAVVHAVRVGVHAEAAAVVSLQHVSHQPRHRMPAEVR